MARLAWLILLALLLAGCGQKGPLYMPENEQAAERYDPQDALPDRPAEETFPANQDAN